MNSVSPQDHAVLENNTALENNAPSVTPVREAAFQIQAYPQLRYQQRCFWFSSRPFFSASLAFAWDAAPVVACEQKNAEEVFAEATDTWSNHWRQVTLRFYSPQGQLFNTVEVEIRRGRANEIPLDPFLEGLGFQNGMRHGFLEVDAPEDLAVRCFARNFSAGFSLQELHRLRGGRTSCLPITAQDHSKHFLILVNPTDNLVSDARVRVLAGGRHKDLVYTIAPKSVELIGIESEFTALLQKAKTAVSLSPGNAGISSGVQVYVRVSARGDAPLGVQILEQQERDERKPQYSFIAF